MHKGDEDFEDRDPSQYFVDCVLDSLEIDDGLFGEAMCMLDNYLNNMPHWQLKGHTPEEAKVLFNVTKEDNFTYEYRKAKTMPRFYQSLSQFYQTSTTF